MAEAKPSTSVVSHSSELEAFRCPLCQEIFKTPVRTHDCHHVFCRQCLLIAVGARGPHCPLCRGALYKWETTSPTRACDIEAMMKSLSHACLYCRRQVKLSYTRLHYKSCKRHQEEFAGAPRVSQVLASDQGPTRQLGLLYQCPLCEQGNLTRKDLLDHCNSLLLKTALFLLPPSPMTAPPERISAHQCNDKKNTLPIKPFPTEGRLSSLCWLLPPFHMVLQEECPICSVLPVGNANYVSRNIVGHLNARHQFSYGDFMNVCDDEEAPLQAAIEESSAFFY
ncbi:E3 ubiquitin-protein ligase RNF138 [Ranitomeya imitator]|uniref:E3 ubiquitin-protein ligase RNF138 n=1 Tax=Ranitomeya imitator TaxID=111125 RepID=UPI0037E77180